MKYKHPTTGRYCTEAEYNLAVANLESTASADDVKMEEVTDQQTQTTMSKANLKVSLPDYDGSKELSLHIILPYL